MKERYLKNAEKTLGKLLIPKKCIEKFGYTYYLEVYDDYMKLIPVKTEKEDK